EVTIPPNIAPLNFSIADSSEHRLIIKGKENHLKICSKDGLFNIPEKGWKRLLSDNAGRELELTVAKNIDGVWKGYIPFKIYIADEPIDPFIAYRLLQLSNDMWNKMGIHQRNLENYEESVIYDNSLTNYNCVNCHTFHSGDPDKMIFHMRGKNAGTVLIDGKKVTKLNTKTNKTVSNFVYMSWHPDGNYLATTVCNTFQHFFINNPNTLEVI
ncbi:Cytochrome c binding protein, partial [gut metagenome]